MKMGKIVYLCFTIIVYYPVSAQTVAKRLISTRWADRQHYLEFIDSSRLIFSSSGQDTTKYTLHADTVNIYYRFTDIRNSDQWPQYREGWTRYRIIEVENDAIHLVAGDSSIQLINIDKLKVPLRRLRSLSISEYAYLTSSGTTDTSGRLIEADTTRTYTVFHLRSSKLYYLKGHAYFSWKNGRVISRTHKLTTMLKIKLNSTYRKMMREKLGEALWLFNNPLPVNNRFYYAVRVRGSRDIETTGTYIHPLMADLWHFLKTIPAKPLL